MKTEGKLVFAPLVRVSTEKQAKQGESLRTQRDQIFQALEFLNGEVFQWYEGQEHASPDYERKILEQLILNAKAKRFDAVIVADLSRWSRDNAKSKQYIRILKEAGIRFFELTREIDLYDPTGEFILGMGIEVAEYFSNQQKYKSLINRISRAKQGYPSCGKLPYGRVYDKNKLKEERWSLDEEDLKRIQTIARLYLEEDYSFQELGKKFGMNPSNLRKILIHRSGSTWEQRFISKKFNIDETVQINIPPLLPQELIEKIRLKSFARRVWDHKTQKHQYLFARHIFDMDTKYSLTGTTSESGQRYYKPYQGSEHRYQVNAEVLEKAVLNSLFEALSCKDSLREAIFEGNPIGDVAEELQNKLEIARKELKSVEMKISNYVTAIGSFGLNIGNRIRAHLEEQNDRSIKLNEEIAALEYQLSTLPSEAEIEASQEWMDKEILLRVKESFLRSGVPLESLPFEEKKKIIKLFFDGMDAKGKRHGVYVKHLGGRPRKYRFVAYGKLGCIDGRIEARTGKYSAFPDIEMFTKDDKELGGGVAKVVLGNNPGLAAGGKKVRECMLSECHAHHRFRLY